MAGSSVLRAAGFLLLSLPIVTLVLLARFKYSGNFLDTTLLFLVNGLAIAIGALFLFRTPRDNEWKDG